jgi:hypothetical protein
MRDSQEIGSAGVCRCARWPAFLGSLHRSLRYRTRYSGNSQNVARDHRELEVLIDSSQSSVHGLADAAHGLAPTEVLFDSWLTA